MSISNKKKLESYDEYLQAEAEVDRLWNKPDDGTMDKLVELMIQYEADNEESLSEIISNDSLLPDENIEDEDYAEDLGFLNTPNGGWDGIW